jgi:NAD(P)-dependent dehydrogenase (short-subunit alcohol dehydrogenase family)
MPVLDFEKKRALVTGGANGIGFAVAARLRADGATVFLVDLPESGIAEAAERIGAEPLPVDATDPAALEQVFHRAGNLDIAIVNAGIGTLGSVLDTSVDLWNRTLAVNLSAAFRTLQFAARGMRAQRRGSIVLTASTNSYDGEANLVAYNASKAGLLGILHTAANELGPYGIRVNAVCPGLIRTRLTSASFSDPQILSDYFRDIPLGRGGEPEEVAQAILFLASDLASYITGATLLVDGGQMASKFGTWGGPGDHFDGERWRRPDL